MSDDQPDQTKVAAARDAIARFMWAMQPNRDPLDTWDDTMAPAWHPEADALLALPDVKALIGCVPAPESSGRSPVRQAAAVLSDQELSEALDLWWAKRRAGQ